MCGNQTRTAVGREANGRETIGETLHRQYSLVSQSQPRIPPHFGISVPYGRRLVICNHDEFRGGPGGARSN